MQRLRNVSLNKQHLPRFILFYNYLFFCWISVLKQRCDWMPMVFRVPWDHIYRLPNPPNGYNISYYYPSLDFASRSGLFKGHGTYLSFPSLRTDAVRQRIFAFSLVARVSSRESARLPFDKILKLFLLQWMRSFKYVYHLHQSTASTEKIPYFGRCLTSPWTEMRLKWLTNQNKYIAMYVRTPTGPENNCIFVPLM